MVKRNSCRFLGFALGLILGFHGPAVALEPEAQAVAGEIATSVATLIRPLAEDWSKTAAERSVTASLTFSANGPQPHDPQCAADLRSQFEAQMRRMATHIGFQVRLAPAGTPATITIVIGNFARADADLSDVPLSQWWDQARAQLGPDLREEERSLGAPMNPRGHNLSGLYRPRNSVLVYGRALLDWKSLDLRANWDSSTMKCRMNFIRDIVLLNTLDYRFRFSSETGRIVGTAQEHAGVSRIHDFLRGMTVQSEIGDLIEANIFCWMVRSPATTSEVLDRCSTWVAESISLDH